MTAPKNERPSGHEAKWRENPFGTHLHFPIPTFDGEGTRLELTIEEIHLRPGNLVHGGVFATLLDTVTGFAAYCAAPPGSEVLTIQLNMSMTATARLGEHVICTAKAVHSGSRTAVVTGEIRRADGKLLVTGSATFFLLKGGVA